MPTLYDTKGGSIAYLNLCQSTPHTRVQAGSHSGIWRNTAGFSSYLNEIGSRVLTSSGDRAWQLLQDTDPSVQDNGELNIGGAHSPELTTIKYDSASLKLGWVGGLTVTSSGLNPQYSDFTFEGWVYVNGLSDQNLYFIDDYGNSIYGSGPPNVVPDQAADSMSIFNNGSMQIAITDAERKYLDIVYCDAISTTNVTVGSASVIDGINVTGNNTFAFLNSTTVHGTYIYTVCLKNQTNPAENGIWYIDNYHGKGWFRGTRLTGVRNPYGGAPSEASSYSGVPDTGLVYLYSDPSHIVVNSTSPKWGDYDVHATRQVAIAYQGTTNANTAWLQKNENAIIASSKVQLLSAPTSMLPQTGTSIYPKQYQIGVTGGSGTGFKFGFEGSSSGVKVFVMNFGSGYQNGDTLTATVTYTAAPYAIVHATWTFTFKICVSTTDTYSYVTHPMPTGPKWYDSFPSGQYVSAFSGSNFKLSVNSPFTPAKHFEDIGVVSTLSIPPRTWTHIAVSRQGSYLRTFINGTLSDTYSISDYLPVTSSGIDIEFNATTLSVNAISPGTGTGIWYDEPGYYSLPCLVSDLIYRVGTAYTTDFTPYVPPGTGYTDDPWTKIHLRWSDPSAGEVMQLYKDGVLLGNITKLDISGSGLDVSITSDQGTVVGNALKLQYGGTDLGFTRVLDLASTSSLTGAYDATSLTTTLGTSSGSGSGTALPGMTWAGPWSDTISYKAVDVTIPQYADVVTVGNSAYVCIQSHVSDAINQPQLSTFDGPSSWQEYWQVITENVSVDSLPKAAPPGLLDSALDWAKNATVGDWAKALIIGGIVGIAGNAVLNSFTNSGSSPGASSTYNGSTTYSGSYTPPSLRQVAESLCIEAGIPAYDVSLLSNTIPCSFSLSQITSNRTVMDNFAKAFQFDMVDSSGILKFVPRNSTPVRTLGNTDMGFNVQGQSIAPVTKKRMQSIDLPKSIALTYIAEDLDYNQFTQISELTTFSDGQDVTLTVPFSMTHQQAKDATDQLLIGAHLERQQYIFKTNYEYAVDLEPGDIVTIPEGNVRIISIEEQDEGVLQITGVDAGYTGAAQPIIVGGVTIGYTAASYVGTGAAAAIPAPVMNSAKVVSASGVFFIDPPVLDSSDTTPRAYAAIHGYGVPGWSGAQIFRSVDGGGTYNLIGSQTVESTWGLVGTPIGDSQSNYWDDVTVITVQLKTNSLNSATDAAVLSGSNLCMIGTECLAFGVATLVSPGTYQLTHLLRGRRGTEWATSSHVANELFVMLDGNLFELPVSDADRGKTWDYKIVSIGSDLTKVDAIESQVIGNNTIPWSPAGLKANLNVQSWNISWIERPRFVNSLQDYFEIGHDPDWGGWLVQIYNGTTVVRQEIVYTTSYTYPPTNQFIDFGALQTHLKVGVIQISNKYGGGHSSIISV